MHKSGFVNIIGRPNVGKSTLMNALVGERMSIITAKPQTTRHRIIGILSGEDFQIVFSDTPGYVRRPSYKMHEAMNRFVQSTFEDADLLLFVTEPHEVYEADDPLIGQLGQAEVPLFLVLNKIDLVDQATVERLLGQWQQRLPFTEALPVSALHGANTPTLLERILEHLPEGPPYYPKDQLSDRPERFFVAEIIRERIFELYRQEIPYCSEVVVESFKETTTQKGEPLVRIMAYIFVERASQKPILIGRNGEAMKRLGMEARKALEKWLEKKVFLELRVKVREKWRDNEQLLKKLGYY